jgi:hypothetical protein
LRIVEAAAASRDEDLRHLVLVEVFLHGDIGNGADGPDLGENAIVINELAGLFNRFRRAERILERDQVDLPAVDAALLVQHLEIADHDTAIARKGGRRPAIGNRLAYFDFGVRNARAIHFFSSASLEAGAAEEKAERPVSESSYSSHVVF